MPVKDWQSEIIDTNIIRLDVPENVSGEWQINTFSVTESDVELQKLRAIVSSNFGRYVPVGTYHRLLHKNEVVMSNTPDEIYDHMPFLYAAEGDVLINGLGLGVVIEMLMIKQKHTGLLKSITVIEKSQDVLNLVQKHYENKYGNRDDIVLKIIHDDAFIYTPQPNTKYNAVWHDIWDSISSDNLPEMTCLHRRYGRRCKWQGSWARYLCEIQKKRSRY